MESKKKNYKNELTYTAETDLQISKTNIRLPKGKGSRGDQLGTWDEHTLLYIKTGEQQRLTVSHKEL